MKKIIAETLLTGLESVSSTVYDDLKKENGKIKSVFTAIIRIPIKVVATFIFSPLILVLILIDVRKKNKISMIKFIIVIIGFIFATITSYLAGTFIGSLAGAAFIASHIGYLTAFGFLIGSSLSVLLTVTFQIIVFNSVTTLFLKISQKDIIDYLEGLVTEKTNVPRS